LSHSVSLSYVSIFSHCAQGSPVTVPSDSLPVPNSCAQLTRSSARAWTSNLSIVKTKWSEWLSCSSTDDKTDHKLTCFRWHFVSSIKYKLLADHKTENTNLLILSIPRTLQEWQGLGRMTT
jgi:hypothetical protein